MYQPVIQTRCSPRDRRFVICAHSVVRQILLEQLLRNVLARIIIR